MRRLFRISALLFLYSLVCAPRTWAQSASAVAPDSFSLVTGRDPILTLNGLFRFHPGDDLHWADPHFDDSHWPLLRSDRSWSEQGYKNMSGFGWYRFQIVIPPGIAHPALDLPTIRTDYEVFADGQRIGGYGGMPPHATPLTPPEQVFALPAALHGSQTVSVAIRVYHWPVWAMYFGGGLTAPPLVGDPALLAAHRHAHVLELYWNDVDDLILTTLESLAGFAAVFLFAVRPAERTYLFFGFMMLFQVADACLNLWTRNHPMDVVSRDWVESCLIGLSVLASVGFYQLILKGRRNWTFFLAIFCVCLQPVSNALHAVSQSYLLLTALHLVYYGWLLALLFRRFGDGLADARLLLVPVTLEACLFLANDVQGILFTAGKISTRSLDQQLGSWPFPFFPFDIVQALYLLGVLAILVHRFVRSNREGDRVAAELEAAREVQHVLVPDTLPPTPGLAIATAYHPAQEVGGDFFQILPLPSGATLVVIGDVAGKGVPAALTVSLVVGTLRTLADYTESPAAILAGLNRRLHGRGTGFTTCLALRFDPADTQARRPLTLANAGHLPPYVNGTELVTESNLPLGLDPDAIFAESVHRLRVADHLAVLTDGVPEAMQGRELFGFDRTAGLSRDSAAGIAAAARQFGQSDDITVLTVDLLPTPVAESTRSSPVLQPA